MEKYNEKYRGCFAYEERGASIEYCVHYNDKRCQHNCEFAVKKDEDKMWEEEKKSKLEKKINGRT